MAGSFRYQVLTFIRDCLPGEAPSAARIGVYVVLLAVLPLVFRHGWFRVPSGPLQDDHAILSMELAINRAFCGGPSRVSPVYRLPYEVRDRPELATVGIRALIDQRAGSVTAYCRSVAAPVLNNENSLMWLDSLLWRLSPDMSVELLGQVLHRCRVFGLWVFAVVLLYTGWGLITTTVAWVYGLQLLAELQTLAHSVYPLLPILLLVTAAAFVVAARAGASRTIAGALVTGAVVGIWTAFAANLRTSHLPLYLAFAVMLFAFGERQRMPAERPARRWTRLSIAAAMFVVGYMAFAYGAIARHLPESDANLSRHTIAHPLVLALGVPESDLSRREQIRWSDAVGLNVARRIDPAVLYLSPGYERALFTYYRGLWEQHTGEMVGVYVSKAKVTGKAMIAYQRTRPGRIGRIIRLILGPLDLFPNGLFYFGLYVSVAGVALVFALRGALWAQVLAFLASAAVMLHVESAIIMSLYIPNYHSYLAFFAVFISIAAMTAAVRLVLDRVVPRLRLAGA